MNVVNYIAGLKKTIDYNLQPINIYTDPEIVSNISNLLILRSLLEDSGHQLILCNVTTMTKCIFVVAGLSKTFVFVDDTSAALAAIKNVNASSSAQSR